MPIPKCRRQIAGKRFGGPELPGRPGFPPIRSMPATRICGRGPVLLIDAGLGAAMRLVGAVVVDTAEQAHDPGRSFGHRHPCPVRHRHPRPSASNDQVGRLPLSSFSITASLRAPPPGRYWPSTAATAPRAVEFRRLCRLQRHPGGLGSCPTGSMCSSATKLPRWLTATWTPVTGWSYHDQTRRTLDDFL